MMNLKNVEDDDVKNASLNNSGSKKSIISVLGNNYNKSSAVFFIQTSIIFIVIICALINLSINTGDKSNEKLWISLLSSSVGILLPNPTIKTKSI